jgi:hypothetical protein
MWHTEQNNEIASKNHWYGGCRASRYAHDAATHATLTSPRLISSTWAAVQPQCTRQPAKDPVSKPLKVNIRTMYTDQVPPMEPTLAILGAALEQPRQCGTHRCREYPTTEVRSCATGSHSPSLGHASKWSWQYMMN